MIMRKCDMILCMTKNNCIGENGHILFTIKEDMERFVRITNGRSIIMGRKTWDSLPQKLNGRVNIVVSQRQNVHSLGEEQPDYIVNSLEAAIDLGNSVGDVNHFPMLIGGASLYNEALDKKYIERCYLTLIHECFPGDTFVDQFNIHDFHVESEESNNQGGLCYSFLDLVYKK